MQLLSEQVGQRFRAYLVVELNFALFHKGQHFQQKIVYFGHTVSSTSASRPVLFNFWPPVVQSSVHSGLKLLITGKRNWLRFKFVIRAEICFDCIQSSNRSKNADSSFCVSSINFPFRVNKKFFQFLASQQSSMCTRFLFLQEN